MKFAVIKTGGKQYVVSEKDEITVDHVNQEPNTEIEFTTLASGDYEKGTVEVGQPEVASKVKGIVLDNVKGDKVRVARYKAKTRFRRVQGFRPMLTKIRITAI